MKRNIRIGFAIFVLILVHSCNRESNNVPLQQKGKAQTEMLQLLQTIELTENLGEYDPVIAKEYIAKAEEFGCQYPEDPMSAEFLYKAGLLAMEVAKATSNSEETTLYGHKALTLFDIIQKVYPEFNGIKNCIINKGIIYEDIFFDYDNAEIFYREFIAIYPTDTLSINLESYLLFFGKTTEDIMADFEEE
jgi:hypothetical protein